MEQETAATGSRFGVSHDLLHELGAHFAFCHGLVAQEFFQFKDVFIGVESRTTPFEAIPAGAASLLIVVFDAFGHIVVDDKTHIGFVDAHAESDGCYDDVHGFHEKFVLGAGARFRIQSCVVGSCFYIVD